MSILCNIKIHINLFGQINILIITKWLNMLTIASLAIIFLLPYVTGLDNGLALTPPMGWISAQRFRCITDCQTYPNDCISERLYMKMTDLLVSEGYLKAGYNYMIVGGCWWLMSCSRDEQGRIQVDPFRFPSGMKALSDYVHSKGLKFGMHIGYSVSNGTSDPELLRRMENDVQAYVDLDVDYITISQNGLDLYTTEEVVAKFGTMLNKTGRPMVYSCNFPVHHEYRGIHCNYKHYTKICNSWRNWIDVEDSWSNIMNILKWFGTNQNRIAAYSSPGHWNDPDVLTIGNFGLSYEQSKAQMAIWALMAAPLIMSNDLENIESKFKCILLNREIIAINQDSLGIQGLLVLTVDEIDIWVKPIWPVVNGSYSYAIGFLNTRNYGQPFKIAVPLHKLSLNHRNGYIVKDIYDPMLPIILKPEDSLKVTVKPSGVVLLKLEASPV